MPTRPSRAPAVWPDEAWTVLALLGAAAVLMVMLRRAGLSIDWRSPGTAAFAAVLTAVGAMRWLLRGGRTPALRAARDMAEYFGLFTAVSLIGAVASYPVAALSHGFVDPWLYRADVTLHFDWVAWYLVVASHPWLQALSRGAYAMIYISPAILLGYLAIADKRAEAYAFIASVALAAVMTLAVFRLTPAVGPFGYLWHGPIPYLPVSDLWQPDLIPQLRDHVAGPIDLGHLVGLVSVPSFHAAAAVVLIAFAAPHRPIRWLLIVANVAMLLSTPVEGTHYLVDMLAGCGIAMAALGLVALLPPLGRAHAARRTVAAHMAMQRA